MCQQNADRLGTSWPPAALTLSGRVLHLAGGGVDLGARAVGGALHLARHLAHRVADLGAGVVNATLHAADDVL